MRMRNIFSWNEIYLFFTTNKIKLVISKFELYKWKTCIVSLGSELKLIHSFRSFIQLNMLRSQKAAAFQASSNVG